MSFRFREAGGQILELPYTEFDPRQNNVNSLPEPFVLLCKSGKHHFTDLCED